MAFATFMSNSLSMKSLSDIVKPTSLKQSRLYVSVLVDDLLPPRSHESLHDAATISQKFSHMISTSYFFLR